MLSDLIKSTKTATSTRSQLNELLLSQSRCKALRVYINTKRPKAPVEISANDVIKVQTKLSISSNVMLGITRGFRTAAKSRKLFEPHLKQKMTDANHILDTYFDIHEDEFVYVLKKKSRVDQRSFIFCNNVSASSI